MLEFYNSNNISDNIWTLIEPHTIGDSGTWGGNAKDIRQFINSCTGAPGVTRVCGRTFFLPLLVRTCVNGLLLILRMIIEELGDCEAASAIISH